MDKKKEDGTTVKELGVSYREETTFNYIDDKKDNSVLKRYVTSYKDDFNGKEELVGTENRIYTYDQDELIGEAVTIYDATGANPIAREDIAYQYEDSKLISEIRHFYVVVDGNEHLVKDTNITNSYENEKLIRKVEDITIYKDAAKTETRKTEEEYDQEGKLTRTIITTDTYSSGALSERKQVVKEYDIEGRLISQEDAKYKTTGGELNTIADERRIKDNFIYDAQHAQKLTSFNLAVYKLNRLGAEELEKAETVDRDHVNYLLKEEELADKAEQKGTSNVNSFEGGIKNYKGFLSDIDKFSKTLPLQKDTVATTLRDYTVYDKSQRITSYKERNFNKGIAKEVIWSVADIINDAVNWFSARIESLKNKLVLLNTYEEEAIAIGDQSYIYELTSQISDAEALIAEFEKLLPLAQEAQIKINNFYNLAQENASEEALKNAQQEIFDVLSPLLKGADEFTWKYEDMVWLAKEDKFYIEQEWNEKSSRSSTAEKLIIELEKELAEAITEAEDAEELAVAEPTPENIAKALELRENVNALKLALLNAKDNAKILKDEADAVKKIYDKAKERVDKIEQSFDVTYDIKKETDGLIQILSSILDVQTQIQRTNITYNELGQISGYTDTTSQFGLSQITAWRSVNSVITINHRIEHNISFLTTRIAILEDELTQAQNQGLLAKVEELEGAIDELISQKEALETLLPLIQAAEDKAIAFYNLVKEGADKELIKNSQAQALEAIGDLGDALDDTIWSLEDKHMLLQIGLDELKLIQAELNDALQVMNDFGKINGSYEVITEETLDNKVIKKTIKEYEFTSDDREQGQSDSMLVGERETYYTYNIEGQVIQEVTDYFRMVIPGNYDSKKMVSRDKVFYEYANGNVSHQKKESYRINSYRQELLIGIEDIFNEYTDGKVSTRIKDLYRVNYKKENELSEKTVSEFTYDGNNVIQRDRVFNRKGELVRQETITSENNVSGVLLKKTIESYLVKEGEVLGIVKLVVEDYDENTRVTRRETITSIMNEENQLEQKAKVVEGDFSYDTIHT
ncbi:MAG: hypothetical protein KKA79_02855, partial [Nanoarchaeota archaeon]|nr:hypothetical protein [Nanoarchaeota archaeon]